jgi:hypothetical protein
VLVGFFVVGECEPGDLGDGDAGVVGGRYFRGFAFGIGIGFGFADVVRLAAG